MQKNKMRVLLVILSLCVIFPITSYAKDDKGTGLGFNLSPIFNANQLDPNSSLFYVKTQPSEEQAFEVRVKSTQKEKVNVNIDILDAYTTYLQTISYDLPKNIENVDSTLKDPVSKIVTTDTKKISVENFEEKIIKFKVSAPEKAYEGVKLGAIQFKSDQKDDKAAMKMTGSSEVGVILASNGEEFNNGKTLLLTKTPIAKLVRGKRMVVANLQNPESKTLENLQINAIITEKKSGKKIKEREVKGAAMAPNSNFDFEIDWGLAQLPSGKFNYKMIVKNDYNEWKFDKDFVISGKLASDINDNSGYQIITPTWLKIVGVVQGILTFVLLIILIVRRKKFEKLFKERKKKSKKNKKKRIKKGE